VNKVRWDSSTSTIPLPSVCPTPAPAMGDSTSEMLHFHFGPSIRACVCVGLRPNTRAQHTLLALKRPILRPLGVFLVSPAPHRRPWRKLPVLGPISSLGLRVRSGQQALRALKRTMGDIKARGAGGISYWSPFAFPGLGGNWPLAGLHSAAPPS